MQRPGNKPGRANENEEGDDTFLLNSSRHPAQPLNAPDRIPRSEFVWRGLALHLGRRRKPVLSLVADAAFPHLFRITYPNGWRSTPANLTRARDAAYGHARHLLGTASPPGRAYSPGTACLNPQNVLIAGERRLKACQALGWIAIPVTVVDVEIVRGELAENMVRKDFTPTEEVEIYRTLEAHLATPVGRPKENGGNFPQLDRGKTRDKVAAFVGKSGRTLEKQVAIVEAAEAEPEKYGRFAAFMDRTGRVNGAFKQLVVARKADAIRKEPPPLPGKGPYRVIVADPPWRFDVDNIDASRAIPYPSMSIEQIKALDVGSIAAPDCVLWLWTTNVHMPLAFDVIAAWGFEHRTICTWCKGPKFGMGRWLRGQSEHCILAVRGKPTVTLTNQTTVLHARAREHSRKPEEFYALVESLCPGSKAELFQRYPREGWCGHGDEVAP